MLALVLVLLSQAQPDSRVTRVERVPGGRVVGGRSGTGEHFHTNSLLWSESFDTATSGATWTKGAGLTLTANYAAAPDGSVTAARLQYTATSGDYVLQTWSVGGLLATASIYLKGTSTSGSIDLCRGGGAGQCIVCSYTSAAWTRCFWTASYTTSSNWFLGCDAPTKGSACSASGDVLIWGAQGETGGLGSYIKTTTTPASRP